MNGFSFLLRSSWFEFRQGVSSGIVSFAFIGLSLYLAIGLLNAEYLQKLGAADVTRNAATVIYLMITGFSFFLLFAYAWIFAQPIMRDRSADLHEMVLTMPVNIKALLWGRYLGATLTAIVLASSVLFGFTIAPLMEWVGWLPVGSFSDIPWHLYAFTMVWIIIPTCMGVGAIYFMMTILTRNLVGPMGAAVFLILLWMLSAAILVEGDINTALASILDPSIFSFALVETQQWTPAQKQNDYLPLSDLFLLNRFIWGLVPIAILFVVINCVSREHLISNSDKKDRNIRIKSTTKQVISNPIEVNNVLRAQNWLKAFVDETRWQIERVTGNKGVWICMFVLLCIGISNTFIHVIWHGSGPLLPDPGMTQTALGKSLHLVLFFIIAGVVGMMCRRDHVDGIDDMLDGLATPSILRHGARAVAVVVVTTLLTLVPAFSVTIVTLLTDPSYLNIGFAFTTQLLVVLPSQIECAIVVFLIHAIVRRTGLAYGASMFAVALLIANHELELLNYPPFELGIPARITFSSLTQWTPWLDYVVLLGFFKVMLCVLLFGIALTLIPRGKDSRFYHVKQLSPRALKSAQVMVLIVAVIGMSGSLSLLDEQLIVKGGYKTVSAERADDAAWEKLWVSEGDNIGFNVQSGHLNLKIDSEKYIVEGHWQLNNLLVDNGTLYGQAPSGLKQLEARANGQLVSTSIDHNLIKITLTDCQATDCDLELTWQVRLEGWSTEATIPWFSSEGIWVDATKVAPTLGIDTDRILRSSLHRERYGLDSNYRLPSWKAAASLDGIAPSADWSWQVDMINNNPNYVLSSPTKGQTTGPLDILISGARQFEQQQFQSLQLLSTSQDLALNKVIADDVLQMKQCVERRLNTEINVSHIVRTPGGQGVSKFAQSVLHLGEDPHWFVAESGVGHMIRKAKIAELLARRHIVDAYPMRNSSGSIIISEGLPGAIGMLCVGDTQGTRALADVTKRFSEAATHALASSEIPVSKLQDDLSDGWAKEYVKLALLSWTAQQTPEQMTAQLLNLSAQTSFNDALNQMFGEALAKKLLGLPSATSFEVKSEQGKLTLVGERRHWVNGGWQKVDANIYAHQVMIDGEGIRLSQKTKFFPLEEDDNSLLLIIDEWPSYQPSGLSVKYNN